MKRREFFKVIGGAALAMVGARAAQARVCERQNGFLDRVYPVGSIYISISSVNPGTHLGGTWVRFGQGRTLVGVDETDTDTIDSFGAVQAIGGAKRHTLNEEEMPSHGHDLESRGNNGSGNNHNHSTGQTTTSPWASYNRVRVVAAGGGMAHNNLPPYITVFMWRRSA